MQNETHNQVLDQELVGWLYIDEGLACETNVHIVRTYAYMCPQLAANK